MGINSDRSRKPTGERSKYELQSLLEESSSDEDNNNDISDEDDEEHNGGFEGNEDIFIEFEKDTMENQNMEADLI